ncbi:MAG: hypothetical protein KJ757_04000 [Planctomycetes bacterium]|nr:hypothetical protein [Planctomycetota bacterium]MBU1517655.1 hypothetical protein [Planctomycetota bacterium]MBU2457887.1 hypothetical protein [Planctomycetota bacterium]MBU2596708.1 hypothetical protein [Planctomycetota bacterium]
MTTLLAILTIIAIIIGPILAVQAQQLIEFLKQKREEKRRLFMVLMATRARPLVPEHVQALNMIDVTFSGKGMVYAIFRGKRKKEEAVIEAWSELRDHLFNYPQQLQAKPGIDIPAEDKTSYQNRCNTWVSRKDELLIELLAKMAESLNYHFDKVLLKRGAYTPAGYGETEYEQLQIRKGLAGIFQGSKSIPIHIVESSHDQEKLSQKTTQQEKSNNKS